MQYISKAKPDEQTYKKWKTLRSFKVSHATAKLDHRGRDGEMRKNFPWNLNCCSVVAAESAAKINGGSLVVKNSDKNYQKLGALKIP